MTLFIWYLFPFITWLMEILLLLNFFSLKTIKTFKIWFVLSLILRSILFPITPSTQLYPWLLWLGSDGQNYRQFNEWSVVLKAMKKFFFWKMFSQKEINEWMNIWLQTQTLICVERRECLATNSDAIREERLPIKLSYVSNTSANYIPHLLLNTKQKEHRIWQKVYQIIIALKGTADNVLCLQSLPLIMKKNVFLYLQKKYFNFFSIQWFLLQFYWIEIQINL